MKHTQRILLAAFLSVVLALVLLDQSCAAPIQRIQGVITEVGEGYLWLKPDDSDRLRKFTLRWKARFIPPKLPLIGDHILILYKDKEQGSVIYGVKYLGITPNPGEAGKGTYAQ